MIIKGTSLKVVDNSGAKWSKCIKVVGKSLVGNTGNLVLVTLSNFINRKKVKKRTIYLGLIVGVKSWLNLVDGSFFRFLCDKLITKYLIILLNYTLSKVENFNFKALIWVVNIHT